MPTAADAISSVSPLLSSPCTDDQLGLRLPKRSSPSYVLDSAAGKPPSPNDACDFTTGTPVLAGWKQAETTVKALTTGVSVPILRGSFGHLPSRLCLRSQAERVYVLGLERAGIIIRRRALANHRHFFLHEPKLRLVFDGRRINSRGPRPPALQMSRHYQYSAFAARYRFAAKFDLRDFFFNCRLSPALYSLFGFRCSLGDFCWTRTPFGWCWSPHFADSIAEDIVRHLRSLGIVVLHYCDDFTVFADTEEECLRALQIAISFCDSVGILVKHRKTVLPTSRLPIVGVTYDLAAKTSSLDASFWPPLSSSLARWQATGRSRKVDLAAFIGTLVFANHAYPGSLCLLNPLFAALAGMEHLPWGSFVDVSSLLPLAERVLALFRSFPDCALQEGRGDGLMIYHDATPTQIAVCWDLETRAQEIPEQHIFVAEAMGFALALDATVEARNRVFVSDNRPLHLALRKGHSSNSYVNRLVYMVLQRRLDGHIINFRWVPSAENPADAPSRMNLREHVP